MIDFPKYFSFFQQLQKQKVRDPLFQSELVNSATVLKMQKCFESRYLPSGSIEQHFFSFSSRC